MHKIIVLNAKGGSGKTTIATNLAACYAVKGRFPALLDYDPQGSALNWLRTRSTDNPKIHGVEAHKKNMAVTRSWQMRMPKEVDRVVIDTPASVSGADLADYVRQADTIIVPVLPSPIDIHTVTNFIKDILVLGKLKTGSEADKPGSKRLGVVANRVKENTRVYRTLQTFLASLNLPFVTALRDSQYYIHAFVEGIGIHELRDARIQSLTQQWQPLLDWLDDIPEETTQETSYRSADMVT
ncbi:nucleotide-binding protein [Kaarinaea lacus]